MDDLFTIAVYDIENIEGSLEKIDNLKTDNELFEKSFPEYLSYYMNSTQYIFYWYLSMLIESFLIFYLVNRQKNKTGKTGDGSTNQGTVL